MESEGTLQDIQQEVLHETLSGVRTNDDLSNADNCCVICLSEITEPCVAVPCSHRNFDFICLATWLQGNSCCPLCKTTLTELHYDLGDTREASKEYKIYKVSGGTLPSNDLQQGITDSARSGQQRQRSVVRGRSRREHSIASRPSESFALSDAENRAQQSLQFRRNVYRHQLYSLHVGSNLSTQYTEWNRDDIAEGSEMLARARAWIRRELLVFGHLYHRNDGNALSENGTRRARYKNAAFVLEYVVAVLKTVDLQASNGHAGTLLADFLGKDNALLFLHELRNFLRSPYSVQEYDRHVQYPEPRQRLGSQGEASRAFGEPQVQVQDERFDAGQNRISDTQDQRFQFTNTRQAARKHRQRGAGR